MTWDAEWLQSLEQHPSLIAIGLVGIRIVGLLVVAPLFGIHAGRAGPWRVKLALAVALLLLIAPSQAPTPAVAAGQTQWVAWGFREAAIGLSLGLAVLALSAGVAMAGEQIHQSLQFADNSNDGSAAPSVRFLELTTFAILLVSGGHRVVIGALLETFQTLPVAHLEEVQWQSVVGLVAVSFSFSVQAAAPVVAATLAAQLALAMLARSQPILRNAALQSSATALAGTGVWLLTLGAIGLLATDELHLVLENLRDILRGGRS